MQYKRIVVTRYGGPESLRVVAGQLPEPRRGEVRIRVLAAGVSLPDVMAREGVHPETPRLPFTPGWDLVGVVDRCGEAVSGVAVGETVAALPISGAYAEYVCLPVPELVRVPPGLDAAEAVSLVLNYVTAYQMLHRTAAVCAGQRILVHGAAGGVGTALLQLGCLAGLRVYGTCSSRSAAIVSALGATPIDYHHENLAAEVLRLTGGGLDAVFDPIGGAHLWQSRGLLRRDGVVVGYGLVNALRGEELASRRPGHRQRFRGTARFALYIVGSWILPGGKRLKPYSIQWLKRCRPAYFTDDLAVLLELLHRRELRPLVARRLPLAMARQAQEMLAGGGVAGKVVLVCNEYPADSVADFPCAT